MSIGVPKIVHYCWFGGKPKPASVERYLANWRSLLPGYEVMEWNEGNFDVDAWPYARQALQAGMYAFVSDVARLHALHEKGGVYLDTDVEIRRSFDALLSGDVVLGFEEGFYIATSTMVAPPRSRLIGDFLESYKGRQFLGVDGRPDQTTNVQVLTSMLVASGLRRDGSAQRLDWRGETVSILERECFSPIDYPNGIDYTDARTFAVHHFGQSWAGLGVRARSSLRKILIRLIGGQRLKRLRGLLGEGK